MTEALDYETEHDTGKHLIEQVDVEDESKVDQNDADTFPSMHFTSMLYSDDMQLDEE